MRTMCSLLDRSSCDSLAAVEGFASLKEAIWLMASLAQWEVWATCKIDFLVNGQEFSTEISDPSSSIVPGGRDISVPGAGVPGASGTVPGAMY